MSLRNKVKRIINQEVVDVKLEAIREYEEMLYGLPFARRFKVAVKLLRGIKCRKKK